MPGQQIKAAIYCRLSEEDRQKQARADDSASIANQKSLLLHYAAEQDWEVYQIYSDDDYTGADRNRPAFLRLLADAEAGRFQVILCKSQSRFTRELELVEKYLHGLFPAWGIRFIGVADHADTAQRGNKKARQINGLVNEWYLEDMSESIKSVLDDRRRQGLHIGAFALYGYRKDPDHKGRLLIDEQAAAVVREIFSRFAAGEGKTQIARQLNARSVPNPTAYKQQQGLAYQGGRQQSGLWHYAQIAAMLQNEMYRGHMVQGRYGSVSHKSKRNQPRPPEVWYRVEHTHPAIIGPGLWQQVQALLAQRAKPFADGSIGLFAGKAVCAHCGYTLRSKQSRGRRYLQCPTRQIAPEACPGAFVSVEALQQAVERELAALLAENLDQERYERELTAWRVEQARAATAELRQELAHLQRQAQEQRLALRTLYLDKARGLLTEAEYLDFAAAFRSQAELAEQRQRDLEQRLSVQEQPQRGGEQPLALTRLHLERMLRSVRVGRRDPKSGELPVTLEWDF